jgi:Domain of unknown function (DUF4288)
MEALNNVATEFTDEEMAKMIVNDKNPYYIAHVIIWVKYKDGNQTEYPVWENIYLIKADTEEEAWEKAEQEGKGYPSPEDDLTVDGRSAEWVYGGVRKVIHSVSGDFINIQIDLAHEDIAELTWNEFTVPDEESLEKLIAGGPVNLSYDE